MGETGDRLELPPFMLCVKKSRRGVLDDVDVLDARSLLCEFLIRFSDSLIFKLSKFTKLFFCILIESKPMIGKKNISCLTRNKHKNKKKWINHLIDFLYLRLKEDEERITVFLLLIVMNC